MCSRMLQTLCCWTVHPRPQKSHGNTSTLSLSAGNGLGVVPGSTDNSNTLNPALHVAIQAHIARISTEEKPLFLEETKSFSQQDLFARIRAFDNSYQSHSDFRPRAAKITTFIEFLERFVAGASIAIQSDPIIASIVVGGTLFVLQSALRFTTYFTKLVDMLERLSDYLSPLIEYARIQVPWVQNCTAAVYVDLLAFYKDARRIFVGSSGNHRTPLELASLTFVRSQWKPFETNFGTIEQSLKHHLNVLQHAAGAMGLHTVHELKSSSEAYQIYIRKKASCSSS